jgi:hypothetical protein
MYTLNWNTGVEMFKGGIAASREHKKPLERAKRIG